MKRRDFLQRIAAAGALPALPLPALASGPAFSEAVYAKAVHLTRIWGTSVPEMYGPALGLDADAAEHLFSRLLRDQVIKTPNASGIARAAAPYFNMTALAPKAASAPAAKAKSTYLKDKLTALAKDELEQTDPPEEPEDAQS